VPEAPKPRVRVTGEKIELEETVEFGTDSAVVLDQSKPLLDEVVTVMTAHPEIKKIRVEGHTDAQGAHDHNVKLSDDRAASVRKYLEGHGIDAKRVVSKGFGPDKPIADNKTEAGRAENRRVEIHILENK
jgi:outer membrane protein OmpA-like peptidoglycan-associated protein